MLSSLSTNTPFKNPAYGPVSCHVLNLFAKKSKPEGLEKVVDSEGEKIVGIKQRETAFYMKAYCAGAQLLHFYASYRATSALV